MVEYLGDDQLRFQQVVNGFSVPRETDLVERIEDS
jgi:hypothetical protein